MSATNAIVKFKETETKKFFEDNKAVSKRKNYFSELIKSFSNQTTNVFQWQDRIFLKGESGSLISFIMKQKNREAMAIVRSQQLLNDSLQQKYLRITDGKFSAGPSKSRMQSEYGCENLFYDSFYGVGTDVIFRSMEGDFVLAHKAVLINKNVYFRNLVNSRHRAFFRMDCSTATLRNLIQFQYLGTISQSSHQHLNELIELLNVAHPIDKDLFDHCVKLISLHLNDNKNLDSETISELLFRSFCYKIDSFITPCLVAAEEYERLGLKVIDWANIPLIPFGKLLVLSVRNNLANVEQTLVDILDSDKSLD